MPIDPSIVLALGQHQGQPQTSPFELLSNLMQVKQQQQQLQSGDLVMRQNALKLRQMQDDYDDQTAIDSTIKKYAAQAKTEGEIDWDKITYDLHAQGRGNAVSKLQTQIIDWRKKQNDDIKVALDNTNSRLTMAARMARSIQESDDPEKAFKSTVPEMSKLLGPQIALIMGDHYDKDVVAQAITKGEDAAVHASNARLAFEKSGDALDRTRQAVQDDRAWAEKLPAVLKLWRDAGSAYLSVARDQRDWDNGIDMLRKGMQVLPTDAVAGLLSEFGTEFNPANKENARLLGMDQGQRSQEKMERARLADAEAALKSNDDVPLSADALEMESEKYARSGDMGPMGLGKVASNNRTLIRNKAAEKYKGMDLAAQASAYKSYQLSLNRLQPLLSNADAWAETGKGNLVTFLKEAQKVIDTGSPAANKPLRSFSTQVLGSPQMASFNTARQVVIPEFARLLTSANLTGVLSDSARKEVDELLKSDYTYRQIYDAAKILVGDSEQRKTAYQDEINGLKRLMNSVPSIALPGRTVGQDTPPATNAAPPANANVKVLPPPANPQRGQVWRSPTGMTWFDGKNWVHDFSNAPSGTKSAAGIR